MMKMKFNNLFLFVGGFILLIILLLQMFKKRENFEPNHKPKPKPKTTTITCVKGKENIEVTAVKPTCPTGYKKK